MTADSKSLTKREVEALPATGKRYSVPDGEVPGLFVRVGAGGAKSFALVYRHEGRQRWLTLGRFGSLTLEEARKLARLRSFEAATGADPASSKIAARRAEDFQALAHRFLGEYCPAQLKPVTAETYRSIITRKMLPAFRKVKLDAIDTPMVVKWHQGLRDTPRQANQALAILSRMLNLATAWGDRKSGLGNPCQYVQKFPEVKRDRALSVEEIGAVFAAMDAMEAAWCAARRKTGKGKAKTPKAAPPMAPPPALACLKLILMTGARRDEIRMLTWTETDLESCPPVLRLRRGKEVKKGDHKGKVIGLSAMAAELIQAQAEGRKLGCPFVFPGKVHPGPLVGLWKIWRRVLETAGIEAARVHDLRHSFGTLAGALGISGPLIQAALNHATPAMSARYTNLKDQQKAEVAERVSQVLKASQTKQA